MASLPNENQLRSTVEQLVNSTNATGSMNFPNQQVTTNHSQQNNPPRILDISHSHSLNTIASVRQEYVLPEDLIAGHRYNGAMSNVRRFFCLFVTFDVLFTTLMWLICITLSGESIKTAVVTEIIHYKISTSLFDIVMAAICRFIVLLLFYAILYVNHWIVIAISTSGTSAFLVAKVILYDWDTSSQPVFKVVLILISFVLAWCEAWFLDFKVLPQEWLANLFFSHSNDVERAPLIRSYVDGLPSIVPTESVGNFYSPMESPEPSQIGDYDRRADDFQSENELPFNSTFTLDPILFSTAQRKAIIEKGMQTMESAWTLLNSPDWKFQKSNGNGDTIEYIPIPKDGKIYKLVGAVSLPPHTLFEELYHNIDNIKNWNPAVVECKKIQDIDEHTDITYQIAADQAGGMMMPRDFVSLRRWDIIDGDYVMAVISINHPNAPPRKQYLRGENGVGCWVVRAHSENPNICTFVWVLNSPVKIWVPQYVLDSAFSNVLFNFLTDIRKRSKILMDGRANSSDTSGM